MTNFTKIEDMSKQPKFKIGDKVKTPPDLYGETEAVVYSIERGYLELNPDGSFDNRGLMLCEIDLKGMSVKVETDGINVKVFMPSSRYDTQRIEHYKFKKYLYSVKSKKMNTLFGENNLKHI